MRVVAGVACLSAATAVARMKRASTSALFATCALLLVGAAHALTLDESIFSPLVRYFVAARFHRTLRYNNNNKTASIYTHKTLSEDSGRFLVSRPCALFVVQARAFGWTDANAESHSSAPTTLVFAAASAATRDKSTEENLKDEPWIRTRWADAATSIVAPPRAAADTRNADIPRRMLQAGLRERCSPPDIVASRKN